MAAEVSLPGVGPVSRRALLLGGGAAAVVMALLWWRRRSSGGAVAPVTDPNDPNALDTGGSGAAGGGGSLTGDAPLASAPTSNPQWTALVMAALGDVAEPSALAQALGRYLTGGAVTAAQESLIDQAIAVAGYPPVQGPGGYPPGIRTQPAGGQTPAPADSGPRYAGVLPGWHVDQWVLDVKAGNAGFPNPDFSYARLVGWNPQVVANINWRSGTTHHTTDNTFKAAATYRVM